MIRELNRRLDLDVNTLLNSSSPKLRLQLSPAELDKRLLNLYDDMASGPRGDVLRWIGAGGSATVSAQWQYLRRMEMKKKVREEWGKVGGAEMAGPVFLEDGGETGRGPSATKWVKRVLRRNMQEQGNDDDDNDGSSANVGGVGLSKNDGASFATGSVSLSSDALVSKKEKGRRKTTDCEMHLVSPFLSWGDIGGCDKNGYRRPQIGIGLGSFCRTPSIFNARSGKAVLTHQMIRMSSSFSQHRKRSSLVAGPLI